MLKENCLIITNSGEYRIPIIEIEHSPVKFCFRDLWCTERKYQLFIKVDLIIII